MLHVERQLAVQRQPSVVFLVVQPMGINVQMDLHTEQLLPLLQDLLTSVHVVLVENTLL